MAKFKKPVFTREEIAELEKGRLSVGYKGGSLILGYDFDYKPFDKKGSLFINAKEMLDGTAKKRQCHKLINNFGWARFDGKVLVFGVKFSSSKGLTKTGESVIKKYQQWLWDLLEQAGWENIKIDDDLGGTDYIVPLNNSNNIKLLYKLSPSIGFYYKSKRPDVADLQKLEYKVGLKKINVQEEHRSR